MRSGGDRATYIGHRSRLRKRFLADEGASMPDYEMLELLLMMSIPRRDVKPLAKSIISSYNDLSGAIKVSIKDLCNINGISKRTAVLMKIVEEGKRRSESPKLGSIGEDRINNWLDLEELARKEIEQKYLTGTYIMYFNSDAQYLGKREISDKAEITEISKPKVIEGLFDFNASMLAVIKYSRNRVEIRERQEIDISKDLAHYLSLLGVSLIDYQILSSEQNISLWHLGLLKSFT